MSLLGEQRTWPGEARNDACDPTRTFAIVNCGIAKGSFDHLVGKREQFVRNCEAQNFGSLKIDDQFEFCRSYDGHIGRLLALEDTARIVATLSISICQVRSVGDQAASFGKFAHNIHRRQRLVRRQRDDLRATEGKNTSGLTSYARPGRCEMVAKAASISPSVLA